MNANDTTKYIKTVSCIAGLLFVAASTFATVFTLPATTSGSGKLDLGFYSGGSVLTVTMSGETSVVSGSDNSSIDTFADGSLVHPIEGEVAYWWGYANAGALDYPTTFGGDGINHYPGGGANYDTGGYGFALAGAWSTDTTNPNTIRYGAVVGTFSASPASTDWFYIGTEATVVVPDGGANLYVAVNDAVWENSSGQYLGDVNVVPEPTTIALGGMAFLIFLVHRNSPRRS